MATSKAAVKINGKYISKGKKKSNTKNAYLTSLINLYERISKQSENPIIHKIAARLKMSRTNRQPIKVSKLVKFNEKYPGKVCVLVCKVLDDVKILELPALNVVCLQISREAKTKIENCGGKVYTLDQLFEVCPGLENVGLYRGKITGRKAYKYFGAAGEKNSRVYPRIIGKGKNREKRLFMKKGKKESYE